MRLFFSRHSSAIIRHSLPVVLTIILFSVSKEQVQKYGCLLLHERKYDKLSSVLSNLFSRNMSLKQISSQSANSNFTVKLNTFKVLNYAK